MSAPVRNASTANNAGCVGQPRAYPPAVAAPNPSQDNVGAVQDVLPAPAPGTGNTGRVRSCHDSPVVRDRPRALGLIACALGAALLALVLLATPREDGDQGPRVSAALFALSAGWMALAARRGVRVHDEGVTLQYLIRSRFITWGEAAGFGTADKRNRFGERLKRPVVFLRSGEAVVVPGAERLYVLSQGRRAGFPVIEELERIRRAREVSSDGT